MWGSIVTIFRMLEKLMYDYAIPFAFINGEKYEKDIFCNKFFFIYKIIRAAEVAQTIEFEHKPTLEELLGTVINRDEVEGLVKRPVEFILLIKI
jgi:hypothetical protein